MIRRLDFFIRWNNTKISPNSPPSLVFSLSNAASQNHSCFIFTSVVWLSPWCCCTAQSSCSSLESAYIILKDITSYTWSIHIRICFTLTVSFKRKKKKKKALRKTYVVLFGAQGGAQSSMTSTELSQLTLSKYNQKTILQEVWLEIKYSVEQQRLTGM